MIKTSNNKYFEYMYEFADDILYNLHEEDVEIAVVGRYCKIKHLIHEIMDSYDEVELGNIELYKGEESCCQFEFVAQISLKGDYVEINCMPLKNGRSYFDIRADIVYIFDDCDSKIVYEYAWNFEPEEILYVAIGEYGDNEYELADADVDDEDCIAEDKGITITLETNTGYRKFSFYPVTHSIVDDIREILKEFGI